MSKKETPAGERQRADEAQLLAIGGRQQQHSATTPTHDSQPKPESNFDFLLGIFGADAANNAFVTGFPEDPTGKHDTRTRNKMWSGRRWGSLKTPLEREWNNYYCISLFRPSEDPKDYGQPRRRKALHVETYVIVFDDVGDGQKVPRENVKLAPSYALETSPGNHQVGYKLATPVKDARKVERLVDGLVLNGLATDAKDPGMRGVTRMVRLPYGTNHKAKYGPGGFLCKLKDWHPERTYTIEQIAEAHGVSLAAPQHSGPAHPRIALQDEQRRAIAEATLSALDAMGCILGEDPNAPGKWHITCPWQDQHTDRDDSGTAYFEPGYVDRSTGEVSDKGGFKCHHGHCENKHLSNLVGFLRTAGYNDVIHPNTMAEFDNLPANLPDDIERDDNDKPTITQDNILRIMQPVYGDMLAYDTFTACTIVKFISQFPDIGEFIRKHPARKAADGLVTRIVCEFQRRFGVEPARFKVEAALNAMLDTREIDSYCTWVTGLPAWDGTLRIDQFLIIFAGAADTPYNRAVSRLLWVSLASRALQPGAKCDCMLILEGAQGIGKSRLVAAIAPYTEWFAVASSDLSDYPRFVLDVLGKVVVEFAELAGLTKVEARTIKALLSRTEDQTRRPYAEMPEIFPRRFVPIGTTNESTYLTDRTGNRRFLPVEVKRCDPEGFVALRDQHWAEALHYVRQKELPILPADIEREANEQQNSRLEENPYETRLRDMLMTRNWPDSLGTAAEVARNFLGESDRYINRQMQNLIADALKGLGYVRGLVSVDGTRARSFIKEKGWTPPNLPDLLR